MRYRPKLLVLFLSAVLLASCVTGITMDSIQNIHRGMSHEDFRSQVTLTPKSSFPIEKEGTKYLVEIYPMQTGTQTVSQYHAMYPHGGYTTTSQVPVYSDYVFIFDQGLLFWGFMNEMQKSDDQLIQQLAPEVSAEYKK